MKTKLQRIRTAIRLVNRWVYDFFEDLAAVAKQSDAFFIAILFYSVAALTLFIAWPLCTFVYTSFSLATIWGAAALCTYWNVD